MKAVKTGFFYVVKIISIFIIVFGIIGLGLSPGAGLLSLSVGILLLILSNKALKNSNKKPKHND